MQAQHVPPLPGVFGKTAFRTDFGGLVLPPGSKVAAYVCSNGAAGLEHYPEITNKLRTTVNAGLALCKAGRGDFVVVLPGHSENIAADAWSNLVTGTRIVGVGGNGAAMPTIRWTATTSQILLDVADVHVEGLRLRMEGANGVVKAMDIAANDCSLVGNDIELSSGASNLAAIGIEVGAALRTKIIGNTFRGTTNNVTDGILIDGVASDTVIANNDMAFAVNANGLIRATGAALRVWIKQNNIWNLDNDADEAIVLNNAALTAFIAYNNIGFTNATISNAITVTAGSAWRFQNCILGAIASSGSMVIPAADT